MSQDFNRSGARSGEPPADRRADVGLLAALRARFAWLAGLAALIWGLELLDTFTGLELDAWGIEPREPAGLAGIIVAPFLHAGLTHVALNSLPLLLLGALAGPYLSTAEEGRDLVFVLDRSRSMPHAGPSRWRS